MLAFGSGPVISNSPFGWTRASTTRGPSSRRIGTVRPAFARDVTPRKRTRLPTWMTSSSAILAPEHSSASCAPVFGWRTGGTGGAGGQAAA